MRSESTAAVSRSIAVTSAAVTSIATKRRGRHQHAAQDSIVLRDDDRGAGQP